MNGCASSLPNLQKGLASVYVKGAVRKQPCLLSLSANIELLFSDYYQSIFIEMYESKTMAVAAPEALTQPALSIMEPSSSLKKGRRTAPDEVWEGPTDEEEYKQYLEFRRKTDWREPYR